MDTYRILSGTFKQPDGTVLGAGEQIELASDVAAAHAAQLQRVQPPLPPIDGTALQPAEPSA